MASKTTKKKQKTLRQLWYTVFPRKKSWSGEAYYDYNLLACVILLTCFGLVMLYSTSAYTAKVKYGSDMAFFGKQAVISVGCIFGMMAISKADYHWIASWGTLLYGVSNILLFATKYVGEDVNGATRWIKLGPVQFQTAEIAKLAIILFIPSVIVKMGRNIKGWKSPLLLLFFGAVTAVLTWKFTNNLSSAMIIAGMTVVLIIVAHPWGTRIAIIGGIASVPAVSIIRSVAVQLAQSSDSFRWGRIQAWLNPESESSGKGYQIMQGLYALGSGGLFGKGLGNSAQKLGTGGLWSGGSDDAVCVPSVPAVFYRAECAGSSGGADRDWYFCPGRSAGDPEYCRCAQCGSGHGNYPSVYQLWRYVHCVPDGGDGHRPERGG